MVMRTPGDGRADSLRKKLGQGNPPDDFTDRELAWLTAHYARSVFVLLVILVVVNVAAALVISAAVRGS